MRKAAIRGPGESHGEHRSAVPVLPNVYTPTLPWGESNVLKHLKDRQDWESKSLTAKGFTLIELLVVIIILGILAAVVIFAVGTVRDRAQTNACKSDAKTLKTAIVAWNTEYVSGDNPTDYPTAYPADVADLTTSPTKLLQEESTLWEFSAGGGNTVPTLGPVGTKCDVNDITQLS